MELGENLPQDTELRTLRSKTAKTNEPQLDSSKKTEFDRPPFTTYRDICQQLIQDPRSSNLFEKYGITYDPNNKLSALYGLKSAMMDRYPVQTTSNDVWEYAQKYQNFTGLSIETFLDAQILSEYIGIEQALIVTETNLPNPFTQNSNTETLKKYIKKRHGTVIDTQDKIDRLIHHEPINSKLSQKLKKINQINGVTDHKTKTVIISPQIHPKCYLFTLAHETYHFSKIDKYSKEKYQLFKKHYFVGEEEFEGNIYALLYDPTAIGIDDFPYSYQDKLSYTVNELIKLSEKSVLSRNADNSNKKLDNS